MERNNSQFNSPFRSESSINKYGKVGGHHNSIPTKSLGSVASIKSKKHHPINAEKERIQNIISSTDMMMVNNH